jgi:hypothetical protein
MAGILLGSVLFLRMAKPRTRVLDNLCQNIILAAQRCRKSNSGLLDAILEWYKILRTLPDMEAALTLGEEVKGVERGGCQAAIVSASSGHDPSCQAGR